ERAERDAERRSVDRLADAIGRRLAGNVAYWPTALDAVTEEWADFNRPDERGNETPVRAALLRVGPGFRLLVGRDIRELAAIRRVLRTAAIYGTTLALGLALVGGLLMALSAQRRLAELNRTTRQIIARDLRRCG